MTLQTSAGREVKLCPLTGSPDVQHTDGRPCLWCWPLLRYPSPLSPRHAEDVVGELLWVPAWRPFAEQLADQMLAWAIATSSNTYAHWRAVHNTLNTLRVVRESERAIARDRRAARAVRRTS